MAHPLATQLAPLIDRDVEELRQIVARWIVNEPCETERARYRAFGVELRALKSRILRRPIPPSEEEIEIALTALLALAGRRRACRPLEACAMSRVVVQGRILYLLESPELLRAQLAGEAVTPARQALVAALSTDEIAPGWACYYYDETLGRYALVGLRGGTIEPDAVRAGGFEVLVSGRSTGCGSSRETAPYALRSAGIRVLIAESFERIFEQNCHNVGLFTATDFSLLDRIERGEPVELEAFTRGLDPISQGVVRSGGLFGYSRGRLEGR